MKELEYKFVLRKDELDQIESCLCNGTPRHISQTNYYYDTEDYLFDKSGVTCRIREKNNKLTGTLKIHGKVVANSNIEIPFKVDKVSNILRIDDIELKLMGALHTKRKIYTFSSGLKVMLDENSYLGKTDCELELEFTEENKKSADKFMDEIEFSLFQYSMMSGYDSSYCINDTPKTKSERFMTICRKNNASTLCIEVK